MTVNRSHKPPRPGADTDWMRDAACRGLTSRYCDAFYPERHASIATAKRVCNGCPVRAECLEYALAHDEWHGVWGGLSENGRRDIARQRKRLAAATL